HDLLFKGKMSLKRLGSIVILQVLLLLSFMAFRPPAIPAAGPNVYYISPIGSDNNDGLAPTVGGGHGPWASPIKADTSAVAGTSGPCTAASGWFTETASICIHILDGSTGWYAAAQNRSYSK